MSTFNLSDHLKNEHRITPFSQYLREIVYGGNDGIVTTFAVVAGFAGAQKDPLSTVPIVSVLLFGLANLFADGISMSLGSFLSLRAEKDVYKNEKAKEQHEILTDPESEYQETIEILKQKKFSEKDATVLASIYRKNTEYWTEFMMKDELEMTNPEHEKSHHIALATFFAFTIFGAIPLIPYILGYSSFYSSIIFTTIALILLGILRSKVARKSAVSAVAETLFVGGIAALVAYIVGTMF